MKKQIFSFAVLLLGLASCSHSEEGIHTGTPVEVKNVSLKVSTAPLTRAVGSTEMGSSDPVTFNEGILYFVSNVNHSIVHKVTVQSTPLAAGTNTLDGNGRTNLIGLSGEETEAVIYNIPVEEDYRVFMVGNPSDEIKAIAGGSFENVEKAVISVLTENRSASGTIDGGVGNVTLYGYGTITSGTTEIEDAEEQTVTITTYQVEVEVGSAVTARIEIPYLEGLGDITSFKLEGIYIGRTYLAVSLNGQAVEASKIGDTSDSEELIGEYEDIPDGILHDVIGVTSNPSTKRVTPGSANDVWAYNVLTYNPYYTGGSDLDVITGAVGNAPSLVFVLSELEADPDEDVYFDNDKPYYITVQGFLNGNGQEINVLEPGYIYRLATGVSVDSDTVTDKPNVKRIDVEVEVKLMGWTDQDVSPVI